MAKNLNMIIAYFYRESVSTSFAETSNIIPLNTRNLVIKFTDLQMANPMFPYSQF